MRHLANKLPRHLSLWFLCLCVFLTSVRPSFSADIPFSKPTSGDTYTFNAMAPLILDGEEAWLRFEHQLKTAKAMGLDGVSVDIWWGKVEALGDQQFDWRYYHRIAALLARYQLQWIPIMSFHQCGGNVGDQCDIPIPDWIWTHFEGQAAERLKFRSEYGNTSSETLSIWQSEAILSEIHVQYAQFMRAFEAEFSAYAHIIQELNVSMGPAGELRYPSYNSHDENTGYPTRGGLQGFSKHAIESFRSYLLKQTDGGGQNASQIAATTPEALENTLNAIDFTDVLQQGNQHQAGLINRYLNWYHNALLQHGKRMLDTAHSSFSGAFNAIPLGFKIPGIHWTMASPDGLARSAEVAAGLIPTSEYNSDNAWGYKPILSIAKAFEKRTNRTVIVHFTALEMSDEKQQPAYSQAKTLVNWISQGASDIGIKLKGENALAAGIYYLQGWRNIQDALSHHFSGLTVLRLGDIADEESNKIGYQQYSRIIDQFK